MLRDGKALKRNMPKRKQGSEEEANIETLFNALQTQQIECHLRLTPKVIGYYRNKTLGTDVRTYLDIGQKPKGVFLWKIQLYKQQEEAKTQK